MKKSIILFFSLFIILFFWMMLLWIFFGRNTNVQKNLLVIVPIANIQYWTWAHEMILYLDYNQTGSLNFLRIFTPTLETLIDSGLIRLKYRIVWEGLESVNLALYCSHSFGKYFEYNKKILASNTVSESSKSSTSLTDMASSLGIEASKFQDCIEKKYFQNSLLRDREEMKSMNLIRFPALILDGEVKDIFNLTPEMLRESVYLQFWQSELWRLEKIMPPGWWQREDGQSGALDESLFYRRIR